MRWRTHAVLTGLVAFAAMMAEAKPAYAYLDPGTGSAVIYVLMSVIAALGYLAYSAVYWVRRLVRGRGADAADAAESAGGGGRGGSGGEAHDDLVVFSEGKDYWLTFQPVVEALIARGRPFRYLSMDMEDPALAIDHPLMDSRYVGKGAVGYARVAATRAKAMLSTTPNMGCPGYPLPKPPRVACLAHVLHGIGDIGTYHKHSVDHYDAVLTHGAFMERSIRHLEKLRGLPAKECFVAGLPHLDGVVKKVRKKDGTGTPPVILLAPSWGEKGFLRLCGTDFIVGLAREGYQLVLRPHPQSWRKEPGLMAEVVRTLAPYPNLRVDREPSPAGAMAAADLLVSETSGIRFEFAFLYERPVITFGSSLAGLPGFDAADLDWVWEDEAARKVGLVVEPGTVADLGPAVREALALKPADIASYRDEHVAHLGHAGEVVADWLREKCAALK